LIIDVIAPDLSEHTFTATATISGNEADADPSNNGQTFSLRTYRTFFVTTTKTPEAARCARHSTA
jgi:hypothetical protein